MYMYTKGATITFSYFNLMILLEYTCASRYLDDMLSIVIVMVRQIYPSELQLNNAKKLTLKPPFWTWTCP